MITFHTDGQTHDVSSAFMWWRLVVVMSKNKVSIPHDTSHQSCPMGRTLAAATGAAAAAVSHVLSTAYVCVTVAFLIVVEVDELGEFTVED